MSDDLTKQPTVDEVVERLRQRVQRASRFVTIEAFPSMGAFEDLPQDAQADAGEGRDGWAIEVERSWRLEPLGNLKLLVAPGQSLDQVLERLDRIRAELVARPELLNEDWSRPIPERPRLRVVKPPEGR